MGGAPAAGVGAGADVDGSRGWCRHLASALAHPSGLGITVVTAHRAARLRVPTWWPLRRSWGGGSWFTAAVAEHQAQHLCPVPGRGVHQGERLESRAGDGRLEPVGLGGVEAGGGPAVAREPAPRPGRGPGLQGARSS